MSKTFIRKRKTEKVVPYKTGTSVPTLKRGLFGSYNRVPNRAMKLIEVSEESIKRAYRKMITGRSAGYRTQILEWRRQKSRAMSMAIA